MYKIAILIFLIPTTLCYILSLVFKIKGNSSKHEKFQRIASWACGGLALVLLYNAITTP